MGFSNLVKLLTILIVLGNRKCYVYSCDNACRSDILRDLKLFFLSEHKIPTSLDFQNAIQNLRNDFTQNIQGPPPNFDFQNAFENLKDELIQGLAVKSIQEPKCESNEDTQANLLTSVISALDDFKRSLLEDMKLRDQQALKKEHIQAIKSEVIQEIQTDLNGIKENHIQTLETAITEKANNKLQSQIETMNSNIIKIEARVGNIEHNIAKIGQKKGVKTDAKVVGILKPISTVLTNMSSALNNIESDLDNLNQRAIYIERNMLTIPEKASLRQLESKHSNEMHNEVLSEINKLKNFTRTSFENVSYEIKSLKILANDEADCIFAQESINTTQGRIMEVMSSIEKSTNLSKLYIENTVIPYLVKIAQETQNSTQVETKLQDILKQSIDLYAQNLTSLFVNLSYNNMTTSTYSPTDNINTDIQVTSTISPEAKSVNACPSRFFKFRDQCFRYLDDTYRNYAEAKAACATFGARAVLAKPDEPTALRDYIVNTYGSYGNFAWWLGGRGTGSAIQWEQDGSTISSSLPLWYGSDPGTKTSSSYCLRLLVHTNHIKPGLSYGVYWMTGCSGSAYTICEWL